MKNENIKMQIDDHIRKIKPKYFNSKEINELEVILKSVRSYIDQLEYEKDKCNCNNYENINKENMLLKSKMDAIKYNIEKNNNIQNIMNYLDDLKNDENIIVRICLKILLSFFYILFYFLLKNNNKKIKKY
jgi:hypothetical protein